MVDDVFDEPCCASFRGVLVVDGRIDVMAVGEVNQLRGLAVVMALPGLDQEVPAFEGHPLERGLPSLVGTGRRGRLARGCRMVPKAENHEAAAKARESVGTKRGLKRFECEMGELRFHATDPGGGQKRFERVFEEPFGGRHLRARRLEEKVANQTLFALVEKKAIA